MAAGLTGDEIAKTLAAEGKTNLATELKGLSDRQKASGKAVLKSWNEYFNLIKDAYSKTNEDTEEPLEEMLKQVKGKWALVSRHDPKKVLQYYHGHGKPSEDWVKKVEHRVQAFKHMEEDSNQSLFKSLSGRQK